MTDPGAPTDAQLRRLRDLRRRAGLSLDTVAERTGLPVAHVQALEEGRIEELPAGPYVGAYYRLIKGVVGGPDEDPPPPAPPPPDRGLPLWLVRTVAFVAVAGLLGLAGYQVWTQGIGDAVEVAGEMVAAPPDTGPDQRVELQARREARFRVFVDGELAFDGVLPNGASRAWEARDRIEIELAGAEDARIQYNDQPIVPQGRQGVPRRLVFIDDLSPDG